MIESFFCAREMDFQLQQQQKQSKSNSIMLLSGPPSCGKSSLLFQFAINSILELEANNGSSKVVFICNRRRLETKPPYLSQGIDPSFDVFERIQMKYIDDDEGLKKYFAAFHLHDTFPVTVIVDDFGDFFDERNCQKKYSNPRGRDLAMVRTLALCHSAIAHAKEKGSPCKLLLSDKHNGDSPRLLFIYKRWIPTIFRVKGDGCGSFLLRSNINPGDGKRKTARFSIALQYLFLEAIYEDNQ